MNYEYAELKARTNFSFLRGASKPEEMLQRAAELGIRALGIADQDGVYGIPKSFQALKRLREENASLPLRLITGATLTIEERPDLTLLVRDRSAYGLLCRLITEAHRDQPKGEAELKWELALEMLGKPEARGVIALLDPMEWEFEENDSSVARLSDLLGDRLFFTLSRFSDGHDRQRMEQALAAGRRFGSGIVAVNDVHCHVRERSALQDVLTANRILKPLDEAGFALFSNSERYLKSPRQMAELFRDFPEAIRNTLGIAESCTFCPSELRYQYPSEWIPQGHTAQSYLEELTWKGASERFQGSTPERIGRQIRYELALISQLGFADYFLTIYEIVDFARSKKILCQGRGSAANSVVCYCLGITAVNPLEMNLLFERFISAERGEPPDIDVDFEHERREEVIQHIYEKYGRHRAAMVAAVITYQERSALRDVKRALGGRAERSPELVDRLCQEIDGFPRHLSIHSGGFTLSAGPISEIVPIEPARMEGRTIIQWDKYDLDYLGLLKVDVLSLGMLSALRRMLNSIGKDRLDELPQDNPEVYTMVQRADTIGVFQIESRAQMSMLGRLKPEKFYDLVIEVAIVRPGPTIGKMVHPYLKRKRGLEPEIYPDPRVRAILERTRGVPLFQEQVMKLAIDLAGFTPGEADELRRSIGAWRASGTISRMSLRLKNGLMKSGLPESFAQQIFDQIQGFAHYGFPESHAISYALLAYASSYLKCHHPAEFACALINSQPMGFYSTHTILDDAKRHGVRILPVHPNLSEWECSLVVLPADDADEAGAVGAGSEHRATRRSRRAIQLGWNIVQGMGRETAEKLIHSRQEKPFQNLSDFLARAKLRTDLLEKLAMAGAFSCFGSDPRHTLWRILEEQISAQEGAQLSLFASVDETLIPEVRATPPERLSFSSRAVLNAAERSFCSQQELPQGGSGGELIPANDPVRGRVAARYTGRSWPVRNAMLVSDAESFAVERASAGSERAGALFPSLNSWQVIQEDYRTYGLSPKAHPMKILREMKGLPEDSRALPKMTSSKVKQTPMGRVVSVAGLVIVRQRPPTAKGVCFVTMEDEEGFIDLILHGPVYEKYEEVFRNHNFLIASGRVQKDASTVNVIVAKVEPIFGDRGDSKHTGLKESVHREH